MSYFWTDFLPLFLLYLQPNVSGYLISQAIEVQPIKLVRNPDLSPDFVAIFVLKS